MGGYDGHRGWIYAMAVSPESRRSGIGSALVRRVESELKQFNCGKVNLQILADNTEVVGFYEQLGYKVEPRISMGKIL
jgi:ribosomal protein S18 acetylase RimI-like enzyme